MSDEEHMTDVRHVGHRPSPDPTILTTEALTREVTALKSLLELRIDSEADARKSADAAVQVLTERELQLIERQRVEQKTDTKLAVDAALQAAKEAVKEQTTASALSINKSENATNEQLKQLSATFTTAIEGVNRAIGDQKDRVNRVEQALATHSAQQGGETTGTDKMMPWVFAIIASVVAIVSIIIQLSH